MLMLCALMGCGHDVTLTPLDGGQPLTGRINGWSGAGELTLEANGDTYSGSWKSSADYGPLAFLAAAWDTTVGSLVSAASTDSVSHSTALLTSRNGKTMYCQFDYKPSDGTANGTCQDENKKIYSFQASKEQASSAPSDAPDLRSSPSDELSSQAPSSPVPAQPESVAASPVFAPDPPLPMPFYWSKPH